MSKILIKSRASILNHPSEIESLKHELLLYDKIGVLYLDSLIQKFYETFKYTQAEIFKDAYDQLKYLSDNNLLVDIEHLIINQPDVKVGLDNTSLANELLCVNRTGTKRGRTKLTR